MQTYIPPPHYVRHTMHTVFETFPGGTTVHADLLLKNLDAAHDFIAYTLVHEADHCSHKAWYAIVTLCVSLCRDGSGCLYAVIQTKSRATPEQDRKP